MPKDWNFILSVVTIFATIIALTQTHKQIKLSNKQYLFDKRVEKYIIATGLIELYRSNSNHFDDKEDEPIWCVDSYFLWLTNNTYLEPISSAINNTLKQPNQKELLIKLEELKSVNTEIKLLFSNKDKVSDLLGDFVLRYKELLFVMYQYKIIIDKMHEANKSNRLSLEEAVKIVGEKKHRIKLQEAFNNLKEADIILKKENVEEKIKKQISLV